MAQEGIKSSRLAALNRESKRVGTLTLDRRAIWQRLSSKQTRSSRPLMLSYNSHMPAPKLIDEELTAALRQIQGWTVTGGNSTASTNSLTLFMHLALWRPPPSPLRSVTIIRSGATSTTGSPSTS